MGDVLLSINRIRSKDSSRTLNVNRYFSAISFGHFIFRPNQGSRRVRIMLKRSFSKLRTPLRQPEYSSALTVLTLTVFACLSKTNISFGFNITSRLFFTLGPPKPIFTLPFNRIVSNYNPQIEMFARFKMKSSFHKTKRII